MSKSISVHAFGSAMIFHVPDDADMDGFVVRSINSRKDVKRQLDDYRIIEHTYGPHPAHLAAELGVTVKVLKTWQSLFESQKVLIS